jgi:hypothetical protein
VAGIGLGVVAVAVPGAVSVTPPLDCPKCDAASTLTPVRSDTRGQMWLYCSCCSTTVLVDASGRIVHVSTKP